MGSDPVARLWWVGTVRLAILSVLTLGLYEAYYIRKQSRIINEHADHQISPAYTLVLFGIAVASAVLFVPYIFLDEGHPISVLSDVSDAFFIGLSLYWGFMARRRMHALLGATHGTPYWFSGVWTLLFTPLYFNYKIGKLNDALPNKALEPTLR